MQKQAPSVGRILIAVGFTLSCFGLILFLWIAFGGPVPLKPESYRITAYFPEATTLAVRVRRPRSAASRWARSRRSSWPRSSTASTATTRPRSTLEIRARVRADLRGREGDPAPEDAAGRDLRRADPRHRARRARRARRRSAPPPTSPTPRPRTSRPLEEGEHAGHRADPGRDPDRRDLQRPRRGDARPRSRAGSPTPPIAIEGRGLDLNDALGNLGPFVCRRRRRARDPQPPEGRAQGPGARHRHRLRGAHRARPGSSPA